MADGNGIVQRWLALWNGDNGQLATLVTNGIVVHAALIWQDNEGPLLGREALRSWIATARAMLRALRFSIEVGPLVDGNNIAVRWRAKGPHGGKTVNFTGTDILRIDQGKIAELWTNADTMLMMQQTEWLLSPKTI